MSPKGRLGRVAVAPLQHRRCAALALVGIGVALSTVPLADASPNAAGSLDRSFGKGGRVITSFAGKYGDEALALAIQQDGKIVAAGRGDGTAHYNVVLARYDRNGNLDRGFGRAGKVRTSFGGKGDDEAYGIVIQPNGEIVVAGSHAVGRRSVFALARYNRAGHLDKSFDQDGKVTTAFAPNSKDAALAIAILPNGKLIAGGVHEAGRRSSFALARYNPTGELDTRFGKGGRVITALAGVLFGLALQPDGKIIAAGSSGLADGFLLARFTDDGDVDESFGTGGKVVTQFGPLSFAFAVALQSDGKIIASGGGGGELGGFALARYTANGNLDEGFGNDGKVTSPFEGGLLGAEAVALQHDGKIVAGGSGLLGGHFVLARYNLDGSLDKSFGSGGKAETSFPSSDGDDLHALKIQTDGRIVAAGASSRGGSRFALARFLAQ